MAPGKTSYLSTLSREFSAMATGRMILSRKGYKATVKTSIWDDAARGYNGFDIEFFPCLAREEFQLREHCKPVGVEYACRSASLVGSPTPRVFAVRRNARQGGTFNDQALERGIAEREDSCAVAGIAISYQTPHINWASPQNLRVVYMVRAGADDEKVVERRRCVRT